MSSIHSTNNFNNINRRTFIKLSTAAVISGFSGCHPLPSSFNFPIEINDDLLRGHLVFQNADTVFEKIPPQKCDTLIVGAGIAGLTAAVNLLDDHLIICDVGKAIGGSSSAETFQGIDFSQGAHYELEYPHYYGSEALEFLSKLKVIQFNSQRQVWEFTEHQYLINQEYKNRCLIDGNYRSSALPDNETTYKFEELIHRYSGQLPMPTRIIPQKLHSLNHLTFHDFLDQHNLLSSPEFIQGVDYRLTDDYGSGMNDVSALAGLHYYQCRPYYTDLVNIFSPPEGNFYFAKKMLDQLSQDQILTSHLVKRIYPENREFRVEVIDLDQNQQKTFQAKRIIYAGQKHGLKYIFPEEAQLFSNNLYAPWVVFNFILNGTVPSKYWQNEIIGYDRDLLGFVNSQTQNPNPDRTVLTTYYCLPREYRSSLIHLNQNPKFWVKRTIQSIALSLKKDITPQIQKCFIKLYGHAMPIPRPGYLLTDKNKKRKYPSLVYAGVDTGRLPLFFEAIDSGVMAAALLKKI